MNKILIAAAAVLALAVGFAASFGTELKRPHIADPREAEQITGARVLTVIKPPEVVVERSRRQADVEAPPLIDVVSESYRTLYLHIASVEASVPIVTITGDDPGIVATVAANLAASAAYEARSTLLVDVDPTTCSVASVLRIRPDPGLSGIITGGATWPEAIVPTTIGRDRPLDVLPSGTRRAGMPDAEVVEEVRKELARMQRRYDFIIIAAPTSYVQRSARAGCNPVRAHCARDRQWTQERRRRLAWCGHACAWPGTLGCGNAAARNARGDAGRDTAIRSVPAGAGGSALAWQRQFPISGVYRSRAHTRSSRDTPTPSSRELTTMLLGWLPLRHCFTTRSVICGQVFTAL